MADEHYTDRRLVELYDLENPHGRDTDYYLGLAERPCRVLDVGCGTGLLAAAYARAGHEVTGVDPADAMLDIARRRPGGDRVRWVHGTAAAVTGEYDLAVMTGHAFQVLLDDDAILTLLGQVRRCLAPHGRFCFETRNPARRAWSTWTPDRTRRHIPTPRGAVQVETQLRAVEGDIVAFTRRYRFADGMEITSDSRLRFATSGHIAGLALRCGFARVSWLGDWNGSPLQDDSAELIAQMHAS